MYDLSSSSFLKSSISQKEQFSNGAILKWSISQMEHFSNGAILKSNISQMEHFSNEAILKSNISQMEHFSNGAILKWSNSQIEHFSNGAIWGRHHQLDYSLVGQLTRAQRALRPLSFIGLMYHSRFSQRRIQEVLKTCPVNFVYENVKLFTLCAKFDTFCQLFSKITASKVEGKMTKMESRFLFNSQTKIG